MWVRSQGDRRRETVTDDDTGEESSEGETGQEDDTGRWCDFDCDVFVRFGCVFVRFGCEIREGTTWCDAK